MKFKVITGTMLTLLLIGMLTLAFKIQPVKASETIYIRANGSIDPPTANITTVDNVTYTFTGNISDFIVVERDNIVVDGAGYTLQGTGDPASKGISLSYRSHVTIKNMKIKAFGLGIYFYNSSNNIISGNTLANHLQGIRLEYLSNSNIISRNTIESNSMYGIWLRRSSNNFIYRNNFVNNTDQVYIVSCVNVWDNGYPSGGNYWSAHVCTHNPSNGSQPYIIDADNIDHYPFQKPNGWIVPGDINGDEIVNIIDIAIWGKAFGSHPGDPRWTPNADLNKDKIVDIFDLVTIAFNFGKKLPL